MHGGASPSELHTRWWHLACGYCPVRILDEFMRTVSNFSFYDSLFYSQLSVFIHFRCLFSFISVNSLLSALGKSKALEELFILGTALILMPTRYL